MHQSMKIFAILAICLSVVVIATDAHFGDHSDENFHTNHHRRGREGKDCPRSKINQTETLRNETCTCRRERGRFFGLQRYRWTNCTTASNTTTTTTAAPITSPVTTTTTSGPTTTTAATTTTAGVGR